MPSNETPLGANRVDVLLATKFFSARMYAELNVSETAASLCVSERDYCAMETGESRISPEMVFKMAALTKCPIKWFYDDTYKEQKANEYEAKLVGRARYDRLRLKLPAGIEALLKSLRNSKIW